MGIKGIHIILIVLAFGLCVGFGAWSLANNQQAMGFISLACAAVVLAYAVNFIKKFKLI